MKQEDKQAVIRDDNVYNKKIKAVPKPDHSIGIDTKDMMLNIIGAGTDSKLDLSEFASFTQISQRRDQLYKLLDMMGDDSMIAAILETYAEDSTEYNPDNQRIVWVESENPNVTAMVEYLLNTMRVDKHIFKWVYSLCKYGDLYLQLFKQSEYDKDDFFKQDENAKMLDAAKEPLNEDLKIAAYKANDKYVHYLEMVPNPAEMFELTKFGKTMGYIKADVFTNSPVSGMDTLVNGVANNVYKYREKDVTLYPATKFVHASLEDNTSRVPEEFKLFRNDAENLEGDDGTTYTVRRGQSLLYSNFKVWRELNLLQNSVLLNRVTKSAIIRTINVEVGDMPKEQVSAHLQNIKALFEQKTAINSGSSMTEYTNPGPIENVVYVPTHNGQGAITSDQIGGDVNIGDMPDIEYYLNLMFGGFRVPKQYFNFTSDSAGFSGGQSLALISSRYAKMVKRIQTTILQALTDAINLMLIDKQLFSYINNFTLHILTPSTQEEKDRKDNQNTQIGVIRDIMSMLSDIEDNTIKLKILKSFLSTVVTDQDIIELIDDEIQKLEAENADLTNGQGSDEGADLGLGDELFTDNGGGGSSSSAPLDLDAELGLETSEEPEGEEAPEPEETAGEELPTPEDLGKDFENNLEEQ